jgi:tetratricopeptide (TPR) repeat protein
MAPLLAGCLHQNVVHNARGLFADAELYRQNGDDSLARLTYQDVVRKTGQALRSRPDGEWADEAKSLLGRAHFRLGEYRPARLVLSEVAAGGAILTLRLDAEIHLAMLAEARGDEGQALDRADRILAGDAPPHVRAVGRLVRGRILARRGFVERAWWEFDRAVESDGSLRLEVGLERLTASIRIEDEARTRAAMHDLLSNTQAGVRKDSVVALLELAAGRWGPATAASFADGVHASAWARDPRSEMALARARLLDQAGDAPAAADAALEVTSGLGSAAAKARLLLARWRLEAAADLSDVLGLRSLLLPSASDSDVAEMLASIDVLERLVDSGLDEPLAWFGAAEVARDRLGAENIARGLFLAYVDRAPLDPWAPKALLAALAVAPDSADRSWLRGRLEAHTNSPYVLAAHGGPAAGYEALEEELDVRLTELGQR